MSLHGSSVPLDSGGFAVLVICPNTYSHQRLMQALNNIVPEAGDPPAAPALRLVEAVPAPHRWISPGGRVYNTRLEAVQNGEQMVSPYVRPDDDEGEPYVIPGCATGACGID